MKYYSKIDWWISILIWMSVGVSGWAVWLIPANEQWIGWLMFSPLMVLMLLFLYNTYYVFEDDYLKCVLGVFPQKIYYQNIKSLKKTRNFLSSAALSAERIEIKEKNKGYIMGTTYISPKNRDEFFDELRMRCSKDVEILN
ncbi:MAG: PH domain-containing protein [Erysipelothrix sp.]|jgi:hypothetical protein|nr:PH domain-containing protein [Erysipelothrix sp.]